MHKQVQVKQARLWRSEVREMAHRKKPMPPGVIHTLAQLIDSFGGIEVSEGVPIEGLSDEDRVWEWVRYLTGDGEQYTRVRNAVTTK